MEEQPQPLEKETAEINGSKTHRLRVVIVFLFLLTVFLVSVYTFILQRNYSENTLESAVEWNTQCADAIHKLVLQKLTGEDYKNISTIADMQSERYQRLQKELSELRKLNPTRYLYTAKMGADGRPIYLIDGMYMAHCHDTSLFQINSTLRSNDRDRCASCNVTGHTYRNIHSKFDGICC